MFEFSQFPGITTERLRLRRLSPDDAGNIHALFGDPEVLRFLTKPLVTSRDDGLERIGLFDGKFQRQESLDWAIELGADGRTFIGICGISSWNRTDRRVDIGYALLREYWGRGFATEAARAIVRWCFENLDVHRVQADCTDGNIGSERVLLNCGFHHEGTWRESCWEHGRFVNIKQFGLLRREWEAT